MDAQVQIINTLKVALDWVAKNKAKHLAISIVGEGDDFIGFMGEVPMEEIQLKSLNTLTEKVKESYDNRQPFPTDPNLDLSNFVYNMAKCPLGFDFVPWLITTEMMRRNSKAPGPLKIAFWWGHNKDVIIGNLEQRQKWLENVFRPCLSLIGAIESDNYYGHHLDLFTTGQLVGAAKKGQEIPKFISAVSIPQDYVTITLRETTYWPHRNSDLNTWYKFAYYLKSKGEQVIFVRDTAKAHEPLVGFDTAPLASIDLHERFRLYDNAKANLFIANGPAALAAYMDRPWFMFIPLEDEDSDYKPNTPSFWRDAHGLEVGEQFPWSNQHQQLIWKDPTYTNLCEAWENIN